MRDCELCKSPARMYCESDRAILCWACDEKVHRANFLVAKHTRCLLCRVCQRPTPWKASGSKFCPTVSVCETCVQNYRKEEEENCDQEESASHGGSAEEYDDDDDGVNETDKEEEEDADDDYDDEEEEEEEEDGENQVVPWTCGPSPPTPSASEEGNSGRWFGSADSVSSLKRNQSTAEPNSDDETGCSSSRRSFHQTDGGNGDRDDVSLERPLKQPRLAEPHRSTTLDDHGGEEPRSLGVMDSLRRFQGDMFNGKEAASAAILEICRLSGDQSRQL